jgi:hypothetical protein
MFTKYSKLKKEMDVKTHSILTIILVAIVICGLSQSSLAWRGDLKGNQTGGEEKLSLSQTEADTLTFMREEEKLARDVYLVMFAYWGSKTFTNIAESEQNHMDAIKTLLDKYGLPDPAYQEIGVFNDPSLQELYEQLENQGKVSKLDALMVGALIEEIDIEDLQTAIDQTDQHDLQRVYGNLMSGSENHLRAFVSQIERLGVNYEAQYLPQEMVDEILAEK